MIFKSVLKKGSNFLYKILLLHRYVPARHERVVPFKSNLLLAVVAFNNPELIELQHEKLVTHLTHPFDYIVVDNSSDTKVSDQLRALCEAKNISYILLPKNPLTGIRTSGSHGIALNWCYRNIIQRYKPTYFGFLDHDLFPLQDVSLAEKLHTGFYGIKKKRPKNFWYLWPGFSFFTYETVKDISINFFPYHGGQDGSIFLDTGGANYPLLYKHLKEGDFAEAQTTLYNRTTGNEFVRGEDSSNVFEIIDGAWLHLRQIAWRKESAHKLKEIEEIISSAKELLSK